jgi:hypothetical protein
MEKHYMIEDLQTGDFSHFTTVQSIFENMVEDYMTNDWTPEEEASIEADFAAMTEEDKMQWVSQVYEYQFHAPGADLLRRWEKDTGYNWLRTTEVKIGGLTDKHIIKLKDISNELDILLMDLNSIGMEAFPDFESKGAQEIEDIYKGIRDKVYELDYFINENE